MIKLCIPNQLLAFFYLDYVTANLRIIEKSGISSLTLDSFQGEWWQIASFYTLSWQKTFAPLPSPTGRLGSARRPVVVQHKLRYSGSPT